MKALAVLAAAILSATPSLSSPSLSLLARDDQIQRHEERFIDSLAYAHPNSSVKLVGFKKIIMTEAQLSALERDIATLPHEWDAILSGYYDPLERALRVYFPVENALVRHGDAVLEASRLGEFPHEAIEGDCSVLGRYQTDQVTGVPGNRIEDGVIYLSEPSPVIRKHGNVHVYDFGWRHGPHAHARDHHLEGRDAHGNPVSRRGDGSGGTCYQNHGNRVCSVAYDIDQGRCDQPKDRSKIKDCIDYNGWPHKNCKKHNDAAAFPLSDCFIAVAKGHCWNEVERALDGDDKRR